LLSLVAAVLASLALVGSAFRVFRLETETGFRAQVGTVPHNTATIPTSTAARRNRHDRVVVNDEPIAIPPLFAAASNNWLRLGRNGDTFRIVRGHSANCFELL
jgi:hypothetical protein